MVEWFRVHDNFINWYRVFIKYCVFSKILKYIPDSGLSRFFLGVYTGLHAWTTKWQVEHQRCSRIGRVKKNHNILRKNAIFNEHTVCERLLLNSNICDAEPCVRCD